MNLRRTLIFADLLPILLFGTGLLPSLRAAPTVLQTPALAGDESWQAEDRQRVRARESREQEEQEFKRWTFIFSCVGVLGTVGAFWFGVLQYAKSEKWKRTEFLADEMTSFFADPDIRNVLKMIDWAPRRINLFQTEDRNPETYPVISREVQISALVPHTLLFGPGSDEEADSNPDFAERECVGAGRRGFTQVEARIRDSYDAFLDHLELLGTYVEERLIHDAELKPYLKYWIEDIAAFTDDSLDAAWTCSLLRYIDTYKFWNVQSLFARYGASIKLDGQRYKDLCALPGVEEILKSAVDQKL